MATPSALFRPNGPTRLEATTPVEPAADQVGESLTVSVIEPPRHPTAATAAVEFEARVPASGSIQIRSGRQTVALHRGMVGRTVTVWVDLRSIHINLDGEVIRTLRSRLLPEDLQHLAMRGARPAGPEPAPPALRRTAGTGVAPTRPGEAIEIERTVDRDGLVSIANTTHPIGTARAGERITLRLDGHLMHAIADNTLIGTWPCPIPTDRIGRLPGARTPLHHCHPHHCPPDHSAEPKDHRAHGDKNWAIAQRACVERVLEELGVDLGELARIQRPARAVQLAVSGLVIMADWIASNDHHW